MEAVGNTHSTPVGTHLPLAATYTLDTLAQKLRSGMWVSLFVVRQVMWEIPEPREGTPQSAEHRHLPGTLYAGSCCIPSDSTGAVAASHTDSGVES